MIEQGAFEEQVQIIDENLNRLRQRLFRNSAMRDAFLHEKARLFSDSFAQDGDYGLLRAIQEETAYERFCRLCEGGLAAARGAGTQQGKISPASAMTDRMINMMDRIEICRILSREADWLPGGDRGAADPWTVIGMLLSGIPREESTPLEVPAVRPVGERVAFLRNLYTDLAFERFSEQIPRCTATYYSDFSGMCEALSYGNVTACILPLENSEDGILLRFYRLLDRYDLRIVMAAEIPSHEGDVVTKYGLLRRAAEIPAKSERNNLLYECNVILEKPITLSDLLLAASLYGLSMVRADARSIPNREGIPSYNLVFQVGEGDLFSMLVFLSLQTPQFTSLGVYRILK